MNWKQELSNRKQLKGKFKDKWGEFPDEEIDQILGKPDVNSKNAFDKAGESARSDDSGIK
jgi:uncharacterized protein YjbJ (UPF0337 family)